MKPTRRCPICTLYHRQGHKATCRAVPAEHRWPFAPLVALRPDFAATLRPDGGYPAERLERWAADGLDDATADRLATLLRFHPVQVWGWDWITAALTPLDEQRLAGGWRHAWNYAEQGARTA